MNDVRVKASDNGEFVEIWIGSTYVSLGPDEASQLAGQLDEAARMVRQSGGNRAGGLRGERRTER